MIPKEPQKLQLKNLIDSNDFTEIRKQVEILYDRFQPYSMEDSIIGEIHLGKRSGGWKFLWNPNIYLIRNGHSEYTKNSKGGGSYRYIPEPNSAYYVYPLTKQGIKSFIDREDIEIYNEYGEKQDKDEFFEMALNWTTWSNEEAWDSDSYHLAHPNEKDWIYKNEYTDFLESLGYKLSKNKSDFYSDGLRFSTSTDFC